MNTINLAASALALDQASIATSCLDFIFRPRSVCLIGASQDAKKLNAAPLRHLRNHGFTGEIFLVNSKYSEISDLPCFSSVKDVPDNFDLAMIMVPAAAVPDALEQSAAKGAKAAIVLSSGFEEDDQGGALALRVREICLEHGIALIGPNCEGIWSVAAKTILTFGSAANREVLHHAPLAIVSQSGAMAGSVARHLQNDGYGCSYLVSVGNETVVSALDVAEYLIQQTDVKVVLMFLEGLRDGEKLRRVAKSAAENGVSIVVLKAGNSEIGGKAAASHTGKLATTYAIYQGAFRQYGIISVSSLVEFIEAAQILLSLPAVRTSSLPHAGVSVCSLPGGTRALTADLCDKEGVPLSLFSDETVAKLESILPVFGQAQNPTDLTAEILSHPGMLNQAMELIADDPATEALIVQFANRGLHDLRERSEALIALAKSRGIPIVVSLLGDIYPADERQALMDQGVAVARDPSDAVRYLSLLYRKSKTSLSKAAVLLSKQSSEAEPRTWAEMAEWLDQAGVDVVPWTLVRPETTPADVVDKVSFPIALKALPETLAHKTELGVLRLGISDLDELGESAANIRGQLGDDSAVLLAQKMIKGGVEVSLAAFRNSDFENVLAIGSGGVSIELFNDITYLTLPVAAKEVERAIGSLKLSQVLDGFRGAPPADRAALTKAIVSFGDAFLTLSPRITEFEVNPLLVMPVGQGVVAVDALTSFVE